MSSAIKKSKARAVADLGEGTILAVVEIAAPADRVFRAISSSEITQWWGSDREYRTTAWTGDLRVGGRWRADGLGADGVAFFVEGEFLEIDPPWKLVHTWRPGWETGSTTTITYRLDPVEGGTRVTLRHVGFTSADSCDRHSQGWMRVLDWLTAYAAPAGDAAPKSFLFKLIAPRPTFPFDMTADERAAMVAHAAYWRKQLDAGVAVVFGPVADPAGPWGLGVVEAADMKEVEALQAADPAIQAGIGMRYDTFPLIQSMVRPFNPQG
jgi:uncharacterized protein YndB with AHSA1/START domain/uncharacterized protein YciI